MIERSDRGLPLVSAIERPCRAHFVESNGRLIVSDNLMNKVELPDKFDRLDIERLTKLKLAELGFVPSNNTESRVLEFLDNPLVHKYPSGNSPARYFMEVIMGKDAILASYLPPYSKTSEHPHSSTHGILEDYYLIGGESSLRLGQNALKLRRGERVEVPLDTYHQLITEEKPAFTLIIMKNAGFVERENWHR
jgi:hypothetical protein